MSGKQEQNFETSLERLDEIVTLLEGEHITLDQSIALFTEGVKLLEQCKDKLATAELKIEELLPEGGEQEG